MLEKMKMNFAPLAATLFISFLCLTQTACFNEKGGENNGGQSSTKQGATSGGLGGENKLSSKEVLRPLKLIEDSKSASVNNFILVAITPKKKGMNLADFLIEASASIADIKVKGIGNKRSEVVLPGKSLADLYVYSPTTRKGTCKGTEDKNFSSGKEVAVRLKCIPERTIPEGTEYTVTVKVKRKGEQEGVEASIKLTRINESKK
ncbi:MAG: hypothetical protein AAF963_01280 [Bacteroidota bacterium]